MTNSQDWWPADFGHYGPLFIRMAWHSAGTYRIGDGRGGAGAGQQRFAPLNSWPDNANLDKARRLLWPIKQKYGNKISWADLMILAGNVALESMGFKTFGFAGGRADVWEPEEDIYWGPEAKWLGDERYSGDRELAQPPRCRADGPDLRQPGRPERQPGSDRGGPGHPRDVRAYGDERRGDGRADCRRPHLRQDPRRRRSVAGRARAGSRRHRGAGPRLEEHASAPARAPTRSPAASKSPGRTTPTKWSNNFFENLFGYEWELTKSPAGAHQWKAEGWRGRRHDAGCPRSVEAACADHADHGPRRCGSTLSTRRSRRRFHENPDQFADAFARAWFKLTHRDMGPIARYLGPEVPTEELIWQDPVPAVDHQLIDEQDIAALKAKILASGLSVSAAGLDRLGVGVDLPRLRQARRRERRAHPPCAAEGLGGQPAGAAGEGAAEARGDPEGVQRRAVRREEGLARRPDRPGRQRGGREGRQGRRRTTSRLPSRRAARTPRRSRPTSSPSPCSSRRADGFRNYLSGKHAVRPRSSWSTGRNC